jgi:hypothetical protein
VIGHRHGKEGKEQHAYLPCKGVVDLADILVIADLISTHGGVHSSCKIFERL